ncbi:ATP-dependent DNA helicase RecG [Gordonia alkanivorans]|uniref:ATP-dependent DNA helicase RecG n=1 Tax=Gordonia alkanivorans TaxID=84096 RepID=UPI0018CC27F5|nr:ATP-dependent DNA helicase RecG [Gordonia alkanivorans]
MVASAADRETAQWSPPLLAELVAELHDRRGVVEGAGADFTRIPALPAQRAGDGVDDPFGRGTTVARGGRPTMPAVSPNVQLRTSADILTPPAGTEPLIFDRTIDSLRGVPVSDLAPHVSPTVISRLEGAGVSSVFDVLMRVPRAYVDRSMLTPLANLSPGAEATFTGIIVGRTINREKRYVRFTVADGTARITCTYFNATWMTHVLRDRDVVVVQGVVGEFNGRPQMSNPIIERLEDASSILIPIYPQSTIRDLATGKRDKELTTGMLRAAATAALQRIPEIDDPVPAPLIAHRQVMSRLEAIRAVHVPDSAAHAAAGRARMAYDELLRLQLALGVIRNAQAAASGITHQPSGTLVDAWMKALPYTLTGAQRRAIDEIRTDLTTASPMNRLLMGDVGAGKTAVTVAAALMAIEGGYQACLLAPTEILARQHFQEISAALGPLGLTVDLLVSKSLPRPRRAVLQALEAGTSHLVIGTHSILQDTVVFRRLGLAMIDEQHRFGVDQRAQLLAKGPGGVCPDVLQATATPIPRTSAITTYGDMAVTVLDEKPAGRVDVATDWIPDAPFDDPNAPPWRAIREEVRNGHQAFVVCSRVDSAGKQSETRSAAAATETADLLNSGVLAGLTVATVHGKQKPEERQQIMDAFTRGSIDVLVATTVIEVGVSVPNATVIVVLDANRFGLAQLHQIRGRVGRGRHPGRCWLVCESSGADTEARMTAMTSTNDGFELAEMDLQIRGAGALTGTEQSGHDARLRVADLMRDARIHLAARDDARRILDRDPQLTRHLTLKREVDLALGDDAQYLTRG